MTELTDNDLKIIHDTHDAVIKITTVLGDGDEGLCGDVKSHSQRLNRIEIVIAGLIGSGVLGGGAIGILKLLGG